MTFARNIFLVLEGVEKKFAFVSVLQKNPQAGTHPFGNKAPLKVGGNRNWRYLLWGRSQLITNYSRHTEHSPCTGATGDKTRASEACK